MAPSTPRRVLVVDDYVDTLDTLREILVEIGGFEVMTASSGLEAIEAAHRFRPDVILLDVSMPGMSGLEVARRIRLTRNLGQTVAIVAVTGHTTPEAVGLMREAGFDWHESKPMSVERILEVAATARRSAFLAPHGHH